MELIAELTEEDELLAHMHADALQLLFRVDLHLGVEEQQAAAAKTAARAAASLACRREQVSCATGSARTCSYLEHVSS